MKPILRKFIDVSPSWTPGNRHLMEVFADQKNPATEGGSPALPIPIREKSGVGG
jgi:hypothetical protein